METKPIKRSKYIAPLSREHHFTLLFCWKIRQGIKNCIDPKRIKSYVDYFWEQHMEKHFREEEQLLFKKVEDEFTLKGLVDHKQIRRIIQRLKETSSVSLLAELAETVESHVRFEERFLFDHLEKNIPEADLQAISARLAEATILPENYKDEFWK